ncbi:hypothetical protein C3L33_20297, partial [Rhododendron williamsianum]
MKRSHIHLPRCLARKWLIPVLFTSTISLISLFITTLPHHNPNPNPSIPISDSNSNPRTGPPELPRFAYYLSGGAGDGPRLKRLLQAAYHPRNSTCCTSTSKPRTPSGSSWPVLVYGFCNKRLIPLVPDLLHIFSYLPRDLNFLEHTSNIGWKEFQRGRPIIVDPGLYHSKKSGVFGAKEKRSLPASFKLFMVGKKVESKGRTTYSEVADEIVAEFTEANSSAVSLDKVEEKNIRRRVYDALNVLMALDIIFKEGKEIRWKGLPSTDVKDMEQNKALRVKLMNQIGKKAAYLKDLEEQTNPHATVEIEISEDMQLVHFDFNSTPFSLHDDAYILKLLRCYQHPESRNNSQNSSVLSSSSSDVASGGTKSFCWNSEMDMSK